MFVGTLAAERPRSLPDLKNRSKNLAGRDQVLTILPGNSRSIAQKSGEIWAGQADLQPISFKDALIYLLPDTSKVWESRDFEG